MIHQALEGRLLLIHLLCKHNARRISAPCIALRIAGSPGKIFIKLFTAISSWLSSRLYLAGDSCKTSIQNSPVKDESNDLERLAIY